MTEAVCSRDGRTIVAAGDDGTLTVSRPGADGPLSRIATGRSATVLALSPDDRTLAAVDSDRRLVLIDIDTGIELGAPVVISTAPVTAVVFSADGREVATADANGKVVQLPADSVFRAPAAAVCATTGLLDTATWAHYAPPGATEPATCRTR